MRLLKGLAILALAIAFTIPVYAETQSIKLSGDLAVRYISRDNYDFNAQDDETADTDASYFMTNAEVQLDADLTDNVAVTIRMVNQHDWNVSDITEATNNHTDYDPNGAISAGGLDGPLDNYGEFDVLVDLAYVTLKEFFFTPLTVRIGKQDLWFGKGFIIGANYEDPNGQISADEFTSFTSFKAIRATWDMEPWTFDGVFAQIEENEVQADDDEQLYGINVGVDLSEYKNAEVELYYWYVKDDEIPNYNTSRENRIHCVGARGSYDPHEDITLWGEIAYQGGNYIANAVQEQPRLRHAWAADIGIESRLWEEQYAWRPVIGAEYIFYSGQNDHDPTGLGEDWHGWDRMFRGKVDSAIHEWYNVFYTNGMPTTDRADTNLHQLILMGTIQPMDNLTVDGRYIRFRAHENAFDYGVGAGQQEKHIGDELDVELTYEYTEDVTFGLLTAWFWSGEYYAVPEDVPSTTLPQGGANRLNSKSVASEVVASCKVTF
ncbi:MAG: alginate export family protein [Candidatus Omnitrophica bacterium]|nr:alginate export family protein [Candidatus Omnitrophota bacterium]